MHSTALFADLDDQQLHRVAEMAQPKSWAARDVLIQKGKPDREINIVVRGRCHVLRRGDDGQERQIASVAPGDHVGEMSLFGNQVAGATVVAAEATETLAVGKSELLELINAHPAIGVRILWNIGHHLVRKLKESGEY